MASADQIKSLLKSHLDGDEERFFSIAMQVAANEARKGHGKLAQEIRALIDDARTEGGAAVAREPVSIARPRGELAELLAVSHPKIKLAEMILEKRLLNRLERIIREQRHIGKLMSHGLRPRQKLLLIGPPGCGKTMTASAMAGELGIPLFVVRLDGLITKYMGETSAKLRLIFDAMEQTRAVYLFDEFDSIGTHRGVTNDVGEIRRVLNSFLMFIEQVKTTSLVLAATNHPQSLDAALYRRFDDLLEYKLPSRLLIVKTLKARLSGYERVKVDFSEAAKASAGLSFADLARACEEAVKDRVIHERDSLTTEALVQAINERTSFQKDQAYSS